MCRSGETPGASSAQTPNGPPVYSRPFDWNLDGNVDGVDLQRLYENFGTIWKQEHFYLHHFWVQIWNSLWIAFAVLKDKESYIPPAKYPMIHEAALA